ncbi:hypothetical protein GCM10007968_10130 [Sporolactobacillus putidus]|uniref:Uncharacterized protein n=1 Tax=Sporolactobacillus putidus TaxID=492735 RepID=A0A917W0Y9_9BACL|nr:hypothetical protein GCM10007968_10130 [Sporolactobacillus putidus]
MDGREECEKKTEQNGHRKINILTAPLKTNSHWLGEPASPLFLCGFLLFAGGFLFMKLGNLPTGRSVSIITLFFEKEPAGMRYAEGEKKLARL